MKKMKSERLSKAAAVALVLLALLSAAVPVNAHMPGAKAPPAFKLPSLVISDEGEEIEITIEDVGKYHNEQMKEFKRKMLKKQNKTDEEIEKIIAKEFAGATGMCPCTSAAFRAALLGISKVWGNEIPERADIKVISSLPTPGSMQCFQYITGTGQGIPNVKSKGEFRMILPDGTEVTDFSIKNIKKLSASINTSNYNFVIIRKSTGEKFEVRVKEDVFPQDFFELRKKVKVKKTATQEEIDKFRKEWEAVRNAFLTQPDWRLFEGIEKPKKDRAILFLLGVMVFGLVLAFIYDKKKAG